MKKMRPVLFLLVSVLAACKEKDNTQPDPASVRITSVKVIALPLTNNGAGWDADGDAEVYVQIENPVKVLYKYPGYYLNVQSSHLPLQFTMQPPCKLPLMNQTYSISLYDYDATADDDYMANASFNPQQFKKDRPLSKTFSGGTVKVKVGFSWD